MRAIHLFLSVASGLAGLAISGPGEAAELSLRRVMLSSAGVGYYEYEAAVEGPASLDLDVKLEQVDDVLKSLVVFDAAGGVGVVSLPGRDDRNGAFGQVPFGREGLASPLAFLNGLVGVEVSVEGPRPMQGRVLRAESVREPGAVAGQDGAVRTRVSLMTEAGLKQFVLEESDTVQVVDPALRGRIARALGAARRETAQDSRRLRLSSPGTGARTVRAGYVAVAPLWKASYRLVLPREDADPATAMARLQGWATLENTSGTDWSKVSLVLQYGNPVTFHQAIYRSYFVTRPEVPVEVLGRLLPDVDLRVRSRVAPSGEAPSPAPPPAPAPAMMAPRAKEAAVQQAIPLAGAGEGAAVQEGATDTVFSLPGGIDVAAGDSASVPILDIQAPAVRVALARPGEAHPLAAIRVTNASPSSLPGGVLTVYDLQGEGRYAGDARLGGLPSGESRLVAYAQDLRTTLEWRQEDTTEVAALTAADGVLAVDQRERRVMHGVVTAPAGASRRVLIEVPKGEGATVAAGFAQPVEETAAVWRFEVALAAGETKEVVYGIDRHERQSIAVLDDDAAVVAVLGLRGVSGAARAALEGVGRLRAQEAEQVAVRDRLVAQRDAVDRDEERLRANLGALQAGDALRTRLLRQLDADETRRGQLDGAVETATAAVARAHRAFSDAVAGLKL